MLNRNSKYFIKDNIKRTLLLKYKISFLIKKSLLHNRTLNKKIRCWVLLKFITNKLYSKKTNNICLLSGKNSTIKKKLLLSRYQINYKIITNTLQNFKINSW